MLIKYFDYENRKLEYVTILWLISGLQIEITFSVSFVLIYDFIILLYFILYDQYLPCKDKKNSTYVWIATV